MAAPSPGLNYDFDGCTSSPACSDGCIKDNACRPGPWPTYVKQTVSAAMEQIERACGVRFVAVLSPQRHVVERLRACARGLSLRLRAGLLRRRHVQMIAKLPSYGSSVRGSTGGRSLWALPPMASPATL